VVKLKNDYILMLGGLNAKTGNTKTVEKIAENGESIINNSGTKFTDCCVFNNIRIITGFFKHKDIHKFIFLASGTKSVKQIIL
jgi:hypothetical protein